MFLLMKPGAPLFPLGLTCLRPLAVYVHDILYKLLNFNPLHLRFLPDMGLPSGHHREQRGALLGICTEGERLVEYKNIGNK